jgi:hypothetical protein
MEIIIYLLAFVASSFSFMITWSISTFFMAPRDFWTKSGFVIFSTKLGMASTAAFYVFSLILIYFN